VRGITDLMVMPGLINLDFADVRSVMSEMGKAMMGTGEASGDNRAIEAAEKAIANPLLDGVSMKGAKGVIVSITGGEDMRLMEVDEAANHIRELVDPDANIIWGSAFNNELDGKIRVSVVATGIEVDAATMAEPARSLSFAPRTPGREEKAVVIPQSVMAPVPTSIVPTTIIETPAPIATVEDDEPLTLVAPEPVSAPTPAASLFSDELLLEPEAVVPTAAAIAAEPEAEATRRWVVEPEAEARTRPPAGATLFERMSNIARGAAKAQVDTDETASADSSVPRFLNRQSNQ
jgi:cell division protein FtsZ